MNWHKYSEEKPPKKEKAYLVTIRDFCGELIVVTDRYYKSDEVRDYECNIVVEAGWRFHDDADVQAWSELPKPFLGGNK